MLTSEQARQKLSPHKEGWLALGINHGAPFSTRAALELLEDVPNYGDGWESREAQYHILRAAMAREDFEACRMHVNDWSALKGRPSKTVSKFLPGDHYHVLDTKFDTLDEAINHLEARGYRYGGLQEKHVYREE